MNPTATIRRLAPGDVQDYRHIRLSALSTTPEAFGSTYEAEVTQADARYASRLATSIVFGAYVEDRIVGMLGCKPHDGAREIHKAFLWGFFVEPDQRGSGLASALLDAALNAAHSIAEQVLLTVVADNRPAIRLYERFGFRPYGTEPRSLKTSGVYADETLMVLFLTDRTSP